jgi:hypothetical protein
MHSKYDLLRKEDQIFLKLKNPKSKKRDFQKSVFKNNKNNLIPAESGSSNK